MEQQQIVKIYFKTIIQGRFEFGSTTSYDKVIKMFDLRAENYYKNDLALTKEDLFDDEKLTLEIPRFVGQLSEKSYKNTVSLLEYCSQFAVAGSVRAWMSDDGRVMHYHLMEPLSDKAAVQSFLKGRKLVKEAGKENEAIAALSKAIEKYDRHAQAYERRAKVCFRMKNFHDAKRDYTKAIGIDPTIPSAYYGRAKVNMLNKDWEDAISDFNQTLKKSIALQPIYWKARRLKAECHLELKQFDLAAFDLKLFANRNFGKDDDNAYYLRWATANYAFLMHNEGKNDDAIIYINKALELPSHGTTDVTDGELIRYRGFAKKAASKSGYLKDLKEAAALGDKVAIAFLEKK